MWQNVKIIATGLAHLLDVLLFDVKMLIKIESYASTFYNKEIMKTKCLCNVLKCLGK